MDSPTSTSVPSTFADVIVPRHLNRSFTYRVPSHLGHHVQVGSLVRIPFGPTTVQGVVISLATSLPDLRGEVAATRLREILSMQEGASGPDLDHDLLRLARLVSTHYLAPLGQCTRLMLPPGRPGRAALYVLTEAGRRLPQQHERLSKTAREVVSRLAARPTGLTEATLRRTIQGPVARSLRDLKRRQWIEERCAPQGTTSHRSERPRPFQTDGARCGDPGSGVAEPAALPCMPPTWVSTLSAALDTGGTSTLLVRAPATYRWACLLRAVEETLARHRTALLVAGEIGRVSVLASYAKARWGDRVEILHSRLSPGARAKAWRRIRDGSAHVVLGTRSAVFAPLRSLGLLCIEGEEETSLKEDQEPRYHARDVARMRAHQHRALFLLGSDHPSVESLEAVDTHGECLLLPAESAERPHVQAVDLRQVPYGTMLSPRMLEGIEAALRAQAGAVIYHNRKGFAPLLMCRDCGAAPRCPQCRVTLTYYRRAGRVACGYCGRSSGLPDTCPSCLATRLEPLGFGTERLEEELRRLFPQARIARLDRDSSRLAAEADRIRRRARDGEVDILIGTRMLFGGAPLPRVGCVGIPLADAGLHLPDFRAAERTYHSLADASGLARAADAGGQVIIQTYLPGHHVIEAVVGGHSGTFYEQERAFRRSLAYPPFGTLIGLRVAGKQAGRVHDAADRVAELLKEAGARPAEAAGPSEGPPGDAGPLIGGIEMAEVFVLGPIPAIVDQAGGRHRRQLIVKSASGEAAREMVTKALGRLEGQKGWRDVKFEVDVDPIEMG